MYTLKNTTLTLTDEQVEEVLKNAGKKEFIKEGQKYWFVREIGIDNDHWVHATSVDIERLERANVYLTEEEAQKADNKRLALGTIQAYIRDNDLQFTPNWEYNNWKWQITGWSYEGDCELYNQYYYNDESKYDLIFKSEEDRQKVIDNCKEELRILLT
jgi:hypothetical protein